MIPKFIESLRELDSEDDVLKACVLCNKKIDSYLEKNDPESTVWQLPLFLSTFKHTLILNNTFHSGQNHEEAIAATKPDVEQQKTASNPASKTSCTEAVKSGANSPVYESSSSGSNVLRHYNHHVRYNIMLNSYS